MAVDVAVNDVMSQFSERRELVEQTDSLGFEPRQIRNPLKTLSEKFLLCFRIEGVSFPNVLCAWNARMDAQHDPIHPELNQRVEVHDRANHLDQSARGFGIGVICFV